MLGTWLWMGLLPLPGTSPNDCNVLSSSGLPHNSHFLSTECPCVHESDCCVHNTTECTLHMNIENEVYNKNVLKLVFVIGCYIYDYLCLYSVSYCPLSKTTVLKCTSFT